MKYSGTISGLRDFLHSKVVDLISSEEYLNDPVRFVKLEEAERLEIQKEIYDQIAFETFTDH